MHCIVNKSEDIHHAELKIKYNKKWFSKLNILERRKPYHVVNDILTSYQLICYTYIGW